MTDVILEPEKITQFTNAFIKEAFLYEVGADGIDTGTNLFEAGVIDSYGLIELVSFLEKQFQITITEDELVSPQLSSVDGIVELVISKRSNALPEEGP